ncbi:MBL fold metallo-hydrolase [Pelobacter seleniigenes]|uniref:MBL fold metallo-hydrolase n=1 Tax=Pelobacter seleniigenes TaxID=407188 RepID=UPI0004A75724|nr:MBL fold metallo-hydrolase [Pelobacter seleniigenes]
MKKIRLWFSLLIVPLCLLLWSCGDDNNTNTKSSATATTQQYGLIVSDPEIIDNGNGQSYVIVDMMTQGGNITVQSDLTASDNIDSVTENLVQGYLVDYVATSSAESYIASVPEDPSKTFNKVLGVSTGTPVFDSMKYGPELSPVNNEAGRMVAAGWVYAKDASSTKTITVGDGRVLTEDISGRALPEPMKRYEETYTVSNSALIYNINTDDYSLSSVSDFASIPVTKDYDYATINRQEAYLVFDKNFTKADAAKVVAIYYFLPQNESDGKPAWDVPTGSQLLADKGTDPVSGKAYVDIVSGKPSSTPYADSTEPFEIVKGFYYIGDNEVAIYLMVADMGTPNDTSDDRLFVFDAGWPSSGYQYWKNIEAMGYDPRNVTDWMLSHGHGDHYGTAVELITMIENAGGSVNVWGPKEDIDGITEDAQGNTWDLAGALPASQTFLREKFQYYTYDTWMDYGNIQIMATPTPGHTTGTASFVFKVKNPDTGEYVSFGYMGGYGFNGLYTPTASNGWKRLNFQLGLAWLAQNIQVDYVSPQHTNQYPIVEVYQALKAYNNNPANAGKQLTMLDALTSTMANDKDGIATEFMNFCEKRYQVATNGISELNNASYSSIENTGPFKPGRENGVLDAQVILKDGGKIVRGFHGAQNVNPLIPLLKDGIVIAKDNYVADEDGYYVQFYIDVVDDYEGYLPDGYHQDELTYATINGDKTLTAIDYVGGPIESLHAAEGTPEVLRTQRLSSLADAQAILNSVQNGGTYYVDLTKASAIIVQDAVANTFTAAKKH